MGCPNNSDTPSSNDFDIKKDLVQIEKDSTKMKKDTSQMEKASDERNKSVDKEGRDYDGRSDLRDTGREGDKGDHTADK